MIPPTPKMARCLEAIRRLTTPAGVPPSYSELASELGYAGAPQICNLLRDMKARGLVDFEPGRARSLRIVERPSDEALQLLEDAELALMQATNRYQSLAQHAADPARYPLPKVAAAHASAERVLCRIARFKGRLNP